MTIDRDTLKQRLRKQIETLTDWNVYTSPQLLEDALNAITDLESEVSSLTPQWQPIETAPKDGTEVLVYDDGAIVVSSWVDDPRESGWWDNGIMTPPPQFWMPLPSPPRGEDGTGEEAPR